MREFIFSLTTPTAWPKPARRLFVLLMPISFPAYVLVMVLILAGIGLGGMFRILVALAAEIWEGRVHD